MLLQGAVGLLWAMCLALLWCLGHDEVDLGTTTSRAKQHHTKELDEVHLESH